MYVFLGGHRQTVKIIDSSHKDEILGLYRKNMPAIRMLQYKKGAG